MINKTYILALLLLLPLFGITQTADEIFGERTEIYFSFQLDDMERVNELSRIISIDNLKGENQVYAYANKKEFSNFLSEGIDYTVLQHPGTLIKPRMLDNVDIRNINAWDFYPTYNAYVDMLYQYAEDFPDICEVYSIGYTNEERELLVIRITDNLGEQENEPEVLHSSSMHGDETTGFILLLRLADYLLNEYGNNPRITNMVDEMDIYIIPLANPDGSYHLGNHTIYGAQRYNAMNVDINRNFPDPEDGPHPDGNPWQTETVHYMNFAEEHDFVMGSNIHGGAEVLNYPWDTWATLAADDDWWIYVCREFADTVHIHAPSGYLSGYNNGITNGFQWYSISGGRQDYMNYFHQCREYCHEISGIKLLPANQLPAHWDYNYRSFLNYLEQSLFGVRGRITDSATGNPLEAEVFVLNHEFDSSWVYSSLPLGNYHRLLHEGTYDIKYSKNGYHTQTYTDVVVNNREATIIDVELVSHFSSVNELEEDAFTLYPNPVSSSFVKVKSTEKVISISVVSLNGETVSKQNAEDPILNFVDVGGLASGTYIMLIETEVGSFQKKFMVL